MPVERRERRGRFANRKEGCMRSHRSIAVGAQSARARWVLRAVVLSASLVTATGAMAQAQPGQFARECALMETMVITLIEDHAVAEDLPADRLGNAGLTMLRARMACYQGR